MKVIIFLAILGLSLAGLRGVDKKKPVPHWMPHHHYHASKASGHGHAHSNSNSENSEELFSLTGAIQDGIVSAIQDTTNAITTDIQNNADNVSNLLQETADTICDYTQGAACNLTQQIADNISQSVQNNAATLDPLINATGSDLAYATQNINTTQVDQDIDDGVALAGTALRTAGDVMQVVNAGLSIAADVAFVGTNGLIGATNGTNNPLMNAIQETIDTIESDIQGTIQTLQNDYNETVQTLQNDYNDAVNSITSAIESINGTEISQTTNDIASAIGTGLKLTNSALQDANDGLSIANSVIP